mgnify:CR=1 FL=1
MLPMDKRYTVLVGNYGSGKTELAIAIARTQRARVPEGRIALVDLDIVNPYFRSAEQHALLEAEGISAEVIDPRTLVPFDYDTVIESLEKTGKLMIVHEDHYNCGWGAQLGSYVAENAITLLDAPIVRLGATDTPTPFSPPLEQFVIPSTQRIIEGARKLARL